jgi:hypothetical protein
MGAGLSAAHRASLPGTLPLTRRKLGEDHITWTRLTIRGVFRGDPETTATGPRLLQNQDETGTAIKPDDGAAAGDPLTALLKEPITTAADLLTDAKIGDTAAINAASARWYANGAAIAAVRPTTNPASWPLAPLQAKMKTHLDTTLNEALVNLHQDYPADVAAYDAVHEHIVMMAGALSAGLIAQFSDR